MNDNYNIFMEIITIIIIMIETSRIKVVIREKFVSKSVCLSVLFFFLLLFLSLLRGLHVSHDGIPGKKIPVANSETSKPN